jgi:predicted membrane GTPase involved in stress response
MNERELHIIKYIINKIENTNFRKKQIVDEINNLTIEYEEKNRDIQFHKNLNYLEGINSQLSKDISNYSIDIKNILESGDY